MNDITIKDILGDETINILEEVCNEFEKILRAIIKSKSVAPAILASSLIISLITEPNLNHVNQKNERFLINNNAKDLPKLIKEITLCLENIFYFSSRLEKALVAYSIDEIINNKIIN